MATLAATTEGRKNKSEFVRQVLQEIGALTENPPEGWRRQVEEALAKQKLKMHQVTIYQIRQKAMQKMAQNGDGKKEEGEVAEETPRKQRGRRRGGRRNLTISDIRDILKFARRYGGLSGLSQAVADVQSVVS